MPKSGSASIKTIIPPATPFFAAFLPDKENGIDLQVVPIVCWSLVTFDNDDPDEVIGQIVAGDAIVEVTYVDEEEGFGEFLGYYPSEQESRAAILASIAGNGDIEDLDFEEEGDGEEEEDEDGDEEEYEDDDEEDDDEEDDDDDEEDD